MIKNEKWYTYMRNSGEQRRVSDSTLKEAKVRSRREGRREGEGEKCNLRGALLIECAFLPWMSREGGRSVLECWRERDRTRGMEEVLAMF